MPDEYDPLEAIEHLDEKAQIAVVVSVLRVTRNSLARIETKIDWVQRSLWALITSIVAGIVVFIVTSGTHNQTKANPPPSVTTGKATRAAIAEFVSKVHEPRN